MHSESVVYARILRLHLIIQEAQAEALAVDHLDATDWGRPEVEVSNGRERIRGGVLWHIIDTNHARLMALCDRAFP
jgi:hypothetical protein